LTQCASVNALADGHVPDGAIRSHTALGDCYATLHILRALLRREGGRLVRGITVDDTNPSFTGDHGFGADRVRACTTR
jgi:hypothetical protein